MRRWVPSIPGHSAAAPLTFGRRSWPELGPRIDTVMRTGEATWDEGLLLFLERSGYPEETYHTFSYSPLPDDNGAIGGMLCVVTEDTERVIGERRMATLRELAVGLAAVRTEPEVCAAIEAALTNNQRDLPFTATWLFDAAAGRARLACVTGIERGHPIAAAEIDLTAVPPGDAVTRILAGVPHVVIEDPSRFGTLPTGAWDTPPRRAARSADRAAGRSAAGRHVDRRIESVPPAERGLYRLHRFGGLADCLRHRQCPRL